MIGEGHKYRHCLVMAGGGGRLGVHLGSYAAACEAGHAPDVVLGTCGGALVAALVQAETDVARQLAWLGGPEMYRFWGSVRVRGGHSAATALAGLVRRALDPRPAPQVPDLEGLALFDVPGPWPAWRWREEGPGPHAVLLGARLLHAPGDAGESRGLRALFEPVAIGPARACALLDGAPAATGALSQARSAVAPHWAVMPSTSLPLGDAVRISLTDMVYLPPAQAAGRRWLGGAVDLMPVELAARLADAVWIDRKDPIPPWTMAPAWRAVLGLSARQRQHEVDRAPVALRLDHRGLHRALPRTVLQRRLAWSRGGFAIRLQACRDAEDYRALIQAQFDEGRRRVHAALAARR